MKLTPFGFVAQTEGFLREALSLPPVGGGKWAIQRVINFTDQAGALQVLIDPASGPQKVRMTFHARQTGSFKDSGIQGWIEFNEGESKEPFVLKQTNSTRAAEEIFDIVDRALSHLPEWDNSAGITAPPPAPHSGAGFAPLIPSSAPEPENTTAPEDPQSFIDSIFGGNTAEPAEPEPEPEPTPAADAPADEATAPTDSPEATDEPAVSEQTPEPNAEEEVSTESENPAKKTKAPKAKKTAK